MRTRWYACVLGSSCACMYAHCVMRQRAKRKFCRAVLPAGIPPRAIHIQRSRVRFVKATRLSYRLERFNGTANQSFVRNTIWPNYYFIWKILNFDTITLLAFLLCSDAHLNNWILQIMLSTYQTTVSVLALQELSARNWNTPHHFHKFKIDFYSAKIYVIIW